MGIVQIGILGVAGALLALQFKGGRSEYGIYIAIGVSVFIFLGILGEFQGLLEVVGGIGDLMKLDTAYTGVLAKMIGITYTAEFASSICKDAGYQTIGVQIETFGKILILALSGPVILNVLEIIGAFLS